MEKSSDGAADAAIVISPMPSAAELTFPWLPVEIVEMIFEKFCIHCVQPDKFPNADVTADKFPTEYERLAVDMKSTLAVLCRCSKFTKAIAEPILYHYFATGNLTYDSGMIPDFEGDCMWGYSPEYDCLPDVIQTILTRPELGAHIKALQLVDWYDYTGVNWSEALGVKRKDLGYPDVPEYGDDLNWYDDPDPERPRHYLRGRNPYWDYNTGTAHDVNRPYPYNFVHHWLQDVLMALCPNVEAILLARSHWANSRDVRKAVDHAARFTLPSLRSLALMYSNSNERRPSDGFLSPHSALLSAAGNLHHLYCLIPNVDFLTFSTPSPETITKIVFDTLNYGRSLSEQYPRVEDVEIYIPKLLGTTQSSFEADLLGVKDQLRRLMVTIDERNLIMPRHRYETPHWGYTDGLFSQFPVLTELGIDIQGFCDPRSKEDLYVAGTLANLLPESIETLHIFRVDEGVTKLKPLRRALLELSVAKTTGRRFRALSRVRAYDFGIETGERQRHKNETPLRDVMTAFSDADIQLEVTREGAGLCPRGREVIPGALPARMTYEHYHYGCDDPEHRRTV